ncbi:hypothetical protein M436DRAFT_44496 [Aureobasidium namibiae CBS 147.97]|uniref:DUF7587 domain-containing protein n=1 Tax=Aureobasidium namibiae CBS 147.97 TaxID=1043004 RepID=A0A074WMI4_9PEZI|nr:uncharacterized protein M436DRAFT_44496 [Aureobasidium namibiae CBS 147.97]KEQ74368.1 hypothetical protein M436DRAFT_44496 [Aureobasidium namibiae CBS 147.97]
MAPQTPTSSPSSRSPRSPKFSWSPRHRQALFVFHRRHMNDDQIAFTFNKMFDREIRARGFANGLTKTAIKAQYQKGYRASCPAWQKVEASHDAELEWVSREMAKLDVTGSPSSSPMSTMPRAQKPVQNPKPRQLVAVVIETRQQTSAIAPRQVFKGCPRSMITHNRTRTIGGEQVPIIRATDQNLVVKDPITFAEAHSPVPELLFRFYDDHSRGVRTRHGEISGRHAYLPCGPPAPPSCADDRMFAAVLCHLNNDDTASELISTTSNLFFAMRLAAKSFANPRLYVIRGGALPREKVFHLWPYHLRFKPLRLYYNGKYRNPSSHEYAIWATLPRTAIIHDFALADLERHLLGNPYMATVFRIDEMRTKKGNTHILQNFKKENLELTLATIEGFARLMPQFGINATSPTPVIARLISEIIRSFDINLPKTTPKQWDILGGAFAFALSYHANQTHVAETYLIQAKEAFLSGARIGLGELNWHLNPTKQAKMVKKGLSLGLGVKHTEVSAATVEFQKNVARFAYREKNTEPDYDMTVDEDYTLVENEDEGHHTSIEEHIEIDIEEAETDVEETISVKTPPPSQRSRISYAREASHSGKKIDETFIIYDRSDDEDYVADSDMD